MAFALTGFNGDRVLVFVMGAFAEMSGDVSHICDITAYDLARTHVLYYNDDAKRTKGMYRQHIQMALEHTAHRGFTRLLLDRNHPGPHRPWPASSLAPALRRRRRRKRTKSTSTATSS